MNTWSWQRIIKRAVAIGLLLLILYVLADLLYLSLLPLGVVSRGAEFITPRDLFQSSSRSTRGYGEAGYWQELFDAGPQPLTRTIVISATPTGLVLDLDLWLPQSHFVVTGVLASGLGPKPLTFIQSAFGEIQVGGQSLANSDYSPPQSILDPATHVLRIHFRASRPASPYITVLLERQYLVRAVKPMYDEIVVRFSGLRPQMYPPPDEVTTQEARFSRAAPSFIEALSLRLEPLTNAPLAPPEPKESRQGFLYRLGGIIQIPFLSDLVYSLLVALPLVIFLYIVQHRQIEADLPNEFTGTLTGLLVLHFTLAFLSATAELASEATTVRPFLIQVQAWLRTSLRLYPALFVDTPLLVSPAILGVILPAMLLQRHPGSVPAAKGMLRGSAPATKGAIEVILGLVAWLFIPLVFLFQVIIPRGLALIDWPIWVLGLMASALFILLVRLVLNMLYRQMAAAFPPGGVMSLATLSVLLPQLLAVYFQHANQPKLESFAWLLIVVGVGLALLIAFFAWLWRWVYPLILKTGLPRQALWLLAVPVILLVAPMRSITNASDPFAYDWDVLNFAQGLDNLIPFIWLAGVVYFLYRNGKSDKPSVDALTRTIGILAAATCLFDVTARWLYIPITFLIGWYALEKLIRPAGTWSRLEPLFDAVYQKWDDLLDQILDLNAAEGAYKEFRAKLRTRLGAGEMTWGAYHEQLHERRAQLIKLQKAAVVHYVPVKQAALKFGPRASAWQNGLHGGAWALVFASPWLLLYFSNLLIAPVYPGDPYPLWSLVFVMLKAILRWTAMGFFFGYFYPYLRGNNGLQKGLGWFALAVLPSLPLMALQNATMTDWQASLFWALQVFVQCILLGLVAFDFMILRQGRYDWQALFEIHGIVRIGASTVAIIGAAGGALGNLLQQNAQSWIQFLLKFITPQAPKWPQ